MGITLSSLYDNSLPHSFNLQSFPSVETDMIDPNAKPVYVVQVNNETLGYKTSMAAATRTAKKLMRQQIMQLPLGSHRYWWKQTKDDEEESKFVLFSQPYNDLMKYNKTLMSIRITKLDYIKQVRPMFYNQFASQFNLYK